MSTKSRHVIWGGKIMEAEMCAQGAREAARKAIREADRAEAEAWSLRMEGYGGPAQPSPTIRQCCTGTGLSSSRFEQTVNAFHDSMHPRPASPTPAPSKAGSAIVQPKGDKFGRRPLSSGVQNCTPKHSSQHYSENTMLL